jgi:hypothetical protein
MPESTTTELLNICSVCSRYTVGLATVHMQALLGTLNQFCRVVHQGGPLCTVGPVTIQKL